MRDVPRCWWSYSIDYSFNPDLLTERPRFERGDAGLGKPLKTAYQGRAKVSTVGSSCKGSKPSSADL